MMKHFCLASLSFLVLLLIHNMSLAQTTVVFNLDLKQQMEDSLFVPERGDRAELTGNFYPLERGRNLVLADDEPVDSVFSVEITFQRRYQGDILEYNFVLRTADGTRAEEYVRRFPLQGGRHVLDPTGFGAFAW